MNLGFYQHIQQQSKRGLFVVVLIVSTALIGCQQPNTPVEATSTASQDQTPSKPSSKQASTTNNVTITDDDEAAPDKGQPIQYNVGHWKPTTGKPLHADDLKPIQAALGKVDSVDKDSLDYASNTATKYRLMPDDAPYLDLIDSNNYLEIGWYYANPNDSNNEKKTSVAHAQKAYHLAQRLMGKQAGGQVITNMLKGQIIKDKTVNNIHIEVAKCEFYSCMLVIDKPDTQT